MKCLKQGREAKKWQRRAEELYKDGYGDCDKISVKLVREMESQGLKLGIDFVVVRGRVHNTQHMCLEMYGKNTRKLTISGYRIDGTAKGSWMKVNFKGPYGT